MRSGFATQNFSKQLTVSYPRRLGGVALGKKTDHLQGALDLLILKTLSRGPQHGYGIAVHIQRISEEVLRVEEGSLYPALHRLEQAGWIRAEWGVTSKNRRARFYNLAPEGARRLVEEEENWARLTAGVGRVLRFT
ncbi:MAG: PadR family transcriptional regulator [Bryobacteraceae bacterium]|nr:PadR family transcriptional regulator [Bryobacteraceae bacterium]